MDFTPQTYTTLLKALLERGYQFTSFAEFLNTTSPGESDPLHATRDPSRVTRHSSLLCILRHDVDRIPQNALKMAQLEHSLGINGTYYFRVVPESYDLDIMHEIAGLGHEIGYHYEDVDLVSRGSNTLRVTRDALQITQHKSRVTDQLIDAAYALFCGHLAMFREHFDVQTICMHGSPRSKYDNKLIWQKYDYKALGITGEPYYDVDFNTVAYFTDTGRRWNGHKVSVRDKVHSAFQFDFRTTQDIIDNIQELPQQVMFTIHPERWHDAFLPWTKELLWQNVKNGVKFFVAKRR